MPAYVSSDNRSTADLRYVLSQLQKTSQPIILLGSRPFLRSHSSKAATRMSRASKRWGNASTRSTGDRCRIPTTCACIATGYQVAEQKKKVTLFLWESFWSRMQRGTHSQRIARRTRPRGYLRTTASANRSSNPRKRANQSSLSRDMVKNQKETRGLLAIHREAKKPG